jgi:hypothetical protein
MASTPIEPTLADELSSSQNLCGLVSNTPPRKLFYQTNETRIICDSHLRGRGVLLRWKISGREKVDSRNRSRFEYFTVQSVNSGYFEAHRLTKICQVNLAAGNNEFSQNRLLIYGKSVNKKLR